MLSLMVGDQVTGWYTAAYRSIDVVHYIPLLLVAAILPPMALYSRENREVLTDIFNRSFRYLVMLAFPIGVGMFLLAPRLILFVFGEGFENAAPALRILIWAEVFAFLNYLGGHLLNIIDRQKIYTVIIGATAAFNIILNLLLISSYRSYRCRRCDPALRAVDISAGLFLHREIFFQGSPVVSGMEAGSCRHNYGCPCCKDSISAGLVYRYRGVRLLFYHAFYPERVQHA